MTRILLVGNSFSGTTSYLRERGYDYIILKDILRAISPEKKLKHRVVCDFSSKEIILATVDSIKKPIDAVMTVYENYAQPTAWIAKHLGLPGMPIRSIEACTDKFLMRQLFAKAPEKISPAFALVDSEKDLRDFARKHDFPLILKPANLAKSLLVTKNHDLEELLENYQRATSQIEAVYAKYAPSREPRLLVEEFMEGPVYSVEAFVDATGEPNVLPHIVDYQTGYDIGYDDNFHYSRVLPSKLSAKKQAELRHCAELGVKALGMKNSPAHIEVIFTKEGPRIVEIGARNGGYRERMHGLANGIDIQGAAIALAHGQKPKITATKNEPIAVLELFPKHPGFFDGVSNLPELKKLDSLHTFKTKVEPGSFVGKAADGYKMCALVILHHKDPAQFQKDLDWVNQHVHIKTHVA